MKVAVVGAGAWGTALGVVLSKNGHQVVLWGHRPEVLKRIEAARRNDLHLPGIELPAGWIYEPDLRRAAGQAEATVLAVPSKAMRKTVRQLSGWTGLAISVTKGIEYETGLRMSGLISECMPGSQIVALSGPTLAEEVAKGFPSAIVAASSNQAAAAQAQNLFHRPAFRVYTSTDIAGVELGGALKNVIAIGAGVGDGIGFGDNSKAALVTRALAEMRRLGVACGAQPETFAGLSGLGDLTVTCFSKLSRNRSLGERLGRGEKLDAILASSSSVAEGYPTARSAYRLAREIGVETPIIDEVYAMLYENKNLGDSLRDLTTRSSKSELD